MPQSTIFHSCFPLEKWSTTWVSRIVTLYHLNNQRLSCQNVPEEFQKYDNALKSHLAGMAQWRDKELARPKLKDICRKVLTSLKKHWEGLSLFAQYPEAPMDNNAAERSLRSPVVGRKNYYGAGSDWSGELTAWLFTIFMILNLWDINPWIWMTGYPQACAENGRKPPKDLSVWLPWLMTDERLQELKNHSPPPSLQ